MWQYGHGKVNSRPIENLCNVTQVQSRGRGKYTGAPNMSNIWRCLCVKLKGWTWLDLLGAMAGT